MNPTIAIVTSPQSIFCNVENLIGRIAPDSAHFYSSLNVLAARGSSYFLAKKQPFTDL
jgi:hypothetical protein